MTTRHANFERHNRQAGNWIERLKKFSMGYRERNRTIPSKKIDSLKHQGKTGIFLTQSGTFQPCCCDNCVHPERIQISLAAISETEKSRRTPSGPQCVSKIRSKPTNHNVNTLQAGTRLRSNLLVDDCKTSSSAVSCSSVHSRSLDATVH